MQVNDPALKGAQAKTSSLRPSFIRMTEKRLRVLETSMRSCRNYGESTDDQDWSEFTKNMAYTTGTYVDGGKVTPSSLRELPPQTKSQRGQAMK